MREINRLVLDGPAKSKRTSKTTPVQAPSKRAITLAHRHRWSHIGVYTFVGASAGLNALALGIHAYSHHTGDAKLWWTVPSIMIGLVIPFMVFILAKVAGMQYRAGSRRLAYFTACVGGFLLLLSITHCASAIALLTGATYGWNVASMGATMMAITIDGGLVACELDIVLA